MDTCSSVTAEITFVLTECYEEVDNKECDATAVKGFLAQFAPNMHNQFMDQLYQEPDRIVTRTHIYL